MSFLNTASKVGKSVGLALGEIALSVIKEVLSDNSKSLTATERCDRYYAEKEREEANRQPKGAISEVKFGTDKNGNQTTEFVRSY